MIFLLFFKAPVKRLAKTARRTSLVKTLDSARSERTDAFHPPHCRRKMPRRPSFIPANPVFFRKKPYNTVKTSRKRAPMVHSTKSRLFAFVLAAALVCSALSAEDAALYEEAQAIVDAAIRSRWKATYIITSAWLPSTTARRTNPSGTSARRLTNE